MTHPEHPHDTAVTRELRDSLSGIDTPARPSLEAIAVRGRARQRRRATGLAGVGTACAAMVAVAAIGLTGAGGPVSPGQHADTGTTISTGTIRTDAFTLTHNANGTDSLTLSQAQMFNPAELQKALARDGIPALVKINTDCRSTPALPSPMPSPAGLGVVSIQLPDGTPVGPPAAPGHPGPRKVVIPHNAVNVINPARMPAGSELYFDYVSHGLTTRLINPNSYTCHAGAPPATPLAW